MQASRQIVSVVSARPLAISHTRIPAIATAAHADLDWRTLPVVAAVADSLLSAHCGEPDALIAVAAATVRHATLRSAGVRALLSRLAE